MKKHTLEQRMNWENSRSKVPESKLLSGSLAGKFPVVFDGGKTIIFISDKTKEAETRSRYDLRNKELTRFHR